MQMSDLRSKFYSDLSVAVKSMLLYRRLRAQEALCRQPEKARTMHAIVGAVVTAIGVFTASSLVDWAPQSSRLPIVLIGLALLVLSGTMARRTSTGREKALSPQPRLFPYDTWSSPRRTVRTSTKRSIASPSTCHTPSFSAAPASGRVPLKGARWLAGGHRCERLVRRSARVRRGGFCSYITGFSGTLSSVMASTPGGSGGSGFSGGSSPAVAGGGGGGGSW